MPTKFFGTVRQKNFDVNLWYPPLCIKFFDTAIFLKYWRDAHEDFRHYETNNFRRKNVISPSIHKMFRYPKFSEILKRCPWTFSALWDQNFRRKNVIPPFWSTKLFETKNFLKNSRIPLRKFSAPWDIKVSMENRDMLPLIHKFFSIPQNFRKTEGFLHKTFRFGPVRQKVRTKPWCRSPSYAWKFSIKELFWNIYCGFVYLAKLRFQFLNAYTCTKEGKTWLGKFFTFQRFREHKKMSSLSFYVQNVFITSVKSK